MIQLFKKYKEIILYIFFGGLTTLVNIGTYYLCARLLSVDVLVSNVIAWFVSVSFAYITNKIFVFESKQCAFGGLVKEIGAFFGCRLFSGALDMGIMWLFVQIVGCNDMLVKILSNILVIIINYLFSKLWIFKKQ